jgi:DNA-binding MarR family transcriptional regulator
VISERAREETDGGALIMALQRAAHSTLHDLGTRLADLELTASEINALALLSDGRVRAVGELAAQSGTKPTTLTSLVDRLVRRGHLARDLDPADRRSFLIGLTDQGRPVAEAARAAMSGLEDERLGAISAAELAGFRAVVHALSGSADPRRGT